MSDLRLGAGAQHRAAKDAGRAAGPRGPQPRQDIRHAAGRLQPARQSTASTLGTMRWFTELGSLLRSIRSAQKQEAMNQESKHHHQQSPGQGWSSCLPLHHARACLVR